MKIRAMLLSMLALSLSAASALSGASDWFETTGGAVRLLTMTEPGPKGELRGALEIRLEPGWKTYWQEPGESGVPPQISVADTTIVRDVDIHFPAPQRFDDGISQWAGYADSVMLPVTFQMGDSGAGAAIEADVFLGICETICVPVQAKLSVTPAEDAGPLDMAKIDRAFAGLPGTPDAGFQVVSVEDAGDALRIAVDLPGDAPADLFLAGHDGLMLAATRFERTATGGIFTARILHRGKGETAGADYTLTAGDKAVSGVLPRE